MQRVAHRRHVGRAEARRRPQLQALRRGVQRRLLRRRGRRRSSTAAASPTRADGGLRISDDKGDRELEPQGAKVSQLAVSGNNRGFGPRLYWTAATRRSRHWISERIGEQRPEGRGGHRPREQEALAGSRRAQPCRRAAAPRRPRPGRAPRAARRRASAAVTCASKTSSGSSSPAGPCPKPAWVRRELVDGGAPLALARRAGRRARAARRRPTRCASRPRRRRPRDRSPPARRSRPPPCSRCPRPARRAGARSSAMLARDSCTTSAPSVLRARRGVQEHAAADERADHDRRRGSGRRRRAGAAGSRARGGCSGAGSAGTAGSGHPCRIGGSALSDRPKGRDS